MYDDQPYNVRQTTSMPMPESVIKWRMDTKDVMKDLVPQLQEMGNDKFDKHVMLLMTGIINKINIQGNIDEDTAKDITLQIMNDEAENIGKRYEEYEMQPTDRDTYIDMLLSIVYMALTRAIGDWERKHTVDQGKETVSTTQGFQSTFPFHPGNGMQRQPGQGQWPL